MASNTQSQYEISYKGVKYIFNPNLFVIGMWQYAPEEKKGARVAPKDIQQKLNKLVFGRANLPTIADKMRQANASEEMKKSIAYLKLQIQALKHNAKVPGTLTPQSREFRVGSIYFFAYKAKHQKKLNWFDVYPIIIPFRILEDRIYGINFHYLPPTNRGAFLNKLLPLAYLFQDTMRFNINWEKLLNISPKEAKVCVHCYLKSHIKSRILPVEPEDWAKILYLPIQKFVGPNDEYINPNKVWNDSKTRMLKY